MPQEPSTAVFVKVPCNYIFYQTEQVTSSANHPNMHAQSPTQACYMASHKCSVHLLNLLPAEDPHACLYKGIRQKNRLSIPYRHNKTAQEAPITPAWTHFHGGQSTAWPLCSCSTAPCEHPLPMAAPALRLLAPHPERPPAVPQPAVETPLPLQRTHRHCRAAIGAHRCRRLSGAAWACPAP